MQSLSWAAQVSDLSRFAARRAAALAEQEAERAALNARQLKSRAKRADVAGHSRNAARILAAMAPYTGYRWGTLKDATGLSADDFRAAMSYLIRSKRIDKEFEVRASIYSLPC